MRLIVIFLFFLLVGFGSIFVYAYSQHKQNILFNSNSTITTKFSLQNAPEDSLKGIIASMSGIVNWQPRTATQAIRLHSPRKIQQGEELGTGKNSGASMVIQNAEEIIESSNSYINFIQMLPINIVIAQSAGTVFYGGTGASSMTVRTLDLITSIDRALAIISFDKSGSTVTVKVQKGSVTEGYIDSDGDSATVTVAAGQQFVFDDTTQTGTVQ